MPDNRQLAPAAIRKHTRKVRHYRTKRKKRAATAAAPSLFSDPGIQLGMIQLGLKIVDNFLPGASLAFWDGVDKARRSKDPLKPPAGIDAPAVVNLNPNADGVYE